MGDQRKGGISWTDETWNPIRGCQRVNTDCINCYAERLAATRLANTPAYKGLAVLTKEGPRWTGEVRLDPATLTKPLHWKRPRLVFVNAMSDLFIGNLTDEQISKVVDVMALAHRHTFQVLTKRPERMAALLPKLAERHTAPNGSGWPLPNVWWGASMGHQAAVDAFMPHLEACRQHAAVLWVSAEPLAQALDWTEPQHRGTNVNGNGWLQTIDWMVGGGESDGGHGGARPTPLAAARQLRDDCLNRTDMGRPWALPFQWKQWGEWSPVSFYQLDHQYLAQNNLVYTLKGPDLRHVNYMAHAVGGAHGRIGKTEAGRLLDGKLWDMWPLGFGRHSEALERETRR